MSRGRDPVAHDVGELIRRQARMGRHHQFEQALLAALCESVHVAIEDGLEGLGRVPFRMLRRELLDAVDREEQLEVGRLLGPECAVVVEYGHSLGWRDVVLSPFLGHLADELHNALFCRTVVPRRQGIVRVTSPQRSQTK